MGIERRVLQGSPAVRAADAGKTAGGYAAVFNSETDIGGWWREKILPGAFSKAIKGDVRALFDHNSGRLVGRTTSGTLRLSEDDHGLQFENDLPSTADGNDIATLLERGDLTGMSFGFRVTHDEWDETVNPPLRSIHEVELFEISYVTFPAYDATEAALRSSQAVHDERDQHRRTHNAQHAAQRIALRKAEQDQKFRGLRPGSRDSGA